MTQVKKTNKKSKEVAKTNTLSELIKESVALKLNSSMTKMQKPHLKLELKRKIANLKREAQTKN